MEDQNLVEYWLRRDPVRWISGALAGVFSIAAAFAVGGMLASSHGYEKLFPVKLIGTIILGPPATDISLMNGFYAGAAILAGLGIFFGVLFSHFVFSNSLKALVPMGLVWGIFSWIFIWDLYMQSFRPIFAAQIQHAAAMPICLTFGICLASVKYIHRLFKRDA